MNTPTPTPTCGELSCDECNARTAELTADRDQLRAALALGQQNCDDAYEDLRDERDAARAELATCKGTSELLLESLRAEVQRLKSDGAASAFVDMACRASRAEAEVERLRSDRDCEKRIRKDAEELREDAIARAERAEAERDALAKDKARLDWLEANPEAVKSSSVFKSTFGRKVWWRGAGGDYDTARAAIDAAMKEGGT